MGPNHRRTLLTEFIGCAIIGVAFALGCAYAAGWVG